MKKLAIGAVFLTVIGAVIAIFKVSRQEQV